MPRLILGFQLTKVLNKGEVSLSLHLSPLSISCPGRVFPLLEAPGQQFLLSTACPSSVPILQRHRAPVAAGLSQECSKSQGTTARAAPAAAPELTEPWGQLTFHPQLLMSWGAQDELPGTSTCPGVAHPKPELTLSSPVTLRPSGTLSCPGILSSPATPSSP